MPVFSFWYVPDKIQIFRRANLTLTLFDSSFGGFDDLSIFNGVDFPFFKKFPLFLHFSALQKYENSTGFIRGLRMGARAGPPWGHFGALLEDFGELWRAAGAEG